MVVQYKTLESIGLPEHRVGDDGSLWRYRDKEYGVYTKGWNRLKGYSNKDGYSLFHINYNKRSKVWKLHTLVLLAFVGKRPDGLECRHLNGDPSDNRLRNLVWGTPKENGRDKVHHGRLPRGEMLHNTTLSNQDVVKIREDYYDGAMSTPALSEKYGVDDATIYSIISGMTWKSVGGPISDKERRDKNRRQWFAEEMRNKRDLKKSDEVYHPRNSHVGEEHGNLLLIDSVYDSDGRRFKYICKCKLCGKATKPLMYGSIKKMVACGCTRSESCKQKWKKRKEIAHENP